LFQKAGALSTSTLAAAAVAAGAGDATPLEISAKVSIAGARSIAPLENPSELAEQCSALRLRCCFLQGSPLGLGIIWADDPG